MPNCNLEMTQKSSFRKCRIDCGEYDLTGYYAKIFTHTCSSCKIEYEIEEQESEGEWTLPENLKPSDKQIEYAEAIANKLGKSLKNIITKRQYWQFVHDNVDKYKKIREKEYEERLHDYCMERMEWDDPSWYY